MAEKILFVDDEQNLLDGLKRQFRNRYDADYIAKPRDGLAKIKQQNDYALVVSDMRMPEMGGIEFLSAVKEISPLTVRIMLTGNADQETAVKAVNETGIFRFLLKPCSTEDLAKAIGDALDQHKLLVAEKQLLEQTVVGSVNLLSELISQSNPDADEETTEVKKIIQLLATKSNLITAWEIEVAAALFDIGCMTLPTDVARRVRQKKPMDGNEEMFIDTLPQLSADLLKLIPRFESVAEIIMRTSDDFSSSLPMGARILKISRDYIRALRVVGDRNQAYDQINKERHRYDPLLLFALFESLSLDKNKESDEGTVFEVGVEELIAGQCLLSDIETIDGRLLLLKGRILTELQVSRVKNHERLIGIKKPILVDCRVPTV